MSQFNFAGLSSEELKKLAAEALRRAEMGITPEDLAIVDLAKHVNSLAADCKITKEQVMVALSEALGLKTQIAGKEEKTTTKRPMNRARAIREAFKEVGETQPVAMKYPELEAAYMKRFGQADFSAKIAQYPIPNSK